jgi:hypothetical protein
VYVPEITEGEARGRLRRLYHTIKAQSRVPWVGEPLRVLAQYPNFLYLAWEASRANLLSVHLERKTSELASFQLPADPPPLPTYVLPRDRRGALSLLPVFRYQTAKLLLLLTAWQEALSERPILGQSVEDAFWPPGVLPHFPRHIPLLRVEHAPQPVRRELVQIVDAHGLFAPPDLYRALGYYPTFLSGAWELLRPSVQSPAYEERVRDLLKSSRQLAHALPHALPLSMQRLLLQVSEREIAAGLGILAAYRQVLPRILLDVEAMSRMFAIRED